MKQLYTVKEIADLIGVSKTTIQKAIKSNNLSWQKIERNRQYYDQTACYAIIKAIRPDFSPTETANQTENSTTNIKNNTDNQPQIVKERAQTSANPPTETANQTENSTTNTDHIGRMLDLIEKQSQEKDKIIEELQKELAELRAETARKDAFIQDQSAKLAILLEQSQKLQASSQMLLLSDNREENAETIIENTPLQKQGFFKRFFKKK